MTEINQDNRVFKLINFSPIGFITINFPVQFCSLCRGYLNEPCSICTEKNEVKCDVICQNDTYYHNHCYGLMNSGSKEKSKKKSNSRNVDDDSD